VSRLDVDSVVRTEEPDRQLALALGRRDRSPKDAADLLLGRDPMLRSPGLQSPIDVVVDLRTLKLAIASSGGNASA
jgi:hypothetical protein